MRVLITVFIGWEILNELVSAYVWASKNKGIESAGCFLRFLLAIVALIFTWKI